MQRDLEEVSARCGELSQPWQAVDRAQAQAVLNDPLRRHTALDSLVQLVKSPCVLLARDALNQVRLLGGSYTSSPLQAFVGSWLRRGARPWIKHGRWEQAGCCERCHECV